MIGSFCLNFVRWGTCSFVFCFCLFFGGCLSQAFTFVCLITCTCIYLSKLPHPPPVELLEAGILASGAIMQAFVYVRVTRKTEHLLALSAHRWGLVIVVISLSCPDIKFSSAGEAVFSYAASFLYVFERCYRKQMVIRAS